MRSPLRVGFAPSLAPDPRRLARRGPRRPSRMRAVSAGPLVAQHRCPYTRGMHRLPSHLRLTSTFAALLLVVACGKTEEGTGGSSTGDATDAGSTTGTPTTEPATTEPETTTPTSSTSGVSESVGDTTTTTEPATTEPATTEPATTEPATTEPDTSSTGPDTTTGNLDCEPLPDDDACTVCTKDNCCDEAMACAADMGCQCVFDCVAMGGDPQTCIGQCMVNPATNPALIAAAQCIMGNCGDSCM